MGRKNPFLDEEEEEEENTYEVRKPFKTFQKDELTEAQKKRNFKGLELVKKALIKAGAIIKDYEGGK